MISNPFFLKCVNLTLFEVRRTKQVLAEEAGEARLGSQSMALGSAGPLGLAGTELETNSAPA